MSARVAEKDGLGSLARSEIIKAVIGGLVVAAGGYLGALLISPDQLYRDLFTPNPDHYLGEWRGVLGGRQVWMQIQEQIHIPHSHTFRIKGSLGYVGSSINIPVEGSADSTFIISGPINNGELNIELEREDPQTRTRSERYVRMLPPKGAAGARICPASGDDITKIVPIDQCPPVPGSTMFFR
jgi:hypothetical protein